MQPEKSYRIWFSQRNGSTLLCKGLEDTGIAGKPGEYFNVMEFGSLSEKYGTSSFAELKSKLWTLGSTSNGVFGIKHSLHTAWHRKIFAEFKRLQGFDENLDVDKEELLKELFPNCKHIFLTRRNKVRQAVSWWKAIKDHKWHLSPQQENEERTEFYESNYDFDAIHHLFREAVLRECTIEEYLSTHQIQPLTLVYEDFIQDFEQTIKVVLSYLEIDFDEEAIPNMGLKKTANAHSEQWVQRFRSELQEKMGHEIW